MSVTLHDSHVAPSLCPYCGEMLDGMMAAVQGAGPQPMPELAGNITICGYCGEIAMFTDNEGHLRKLTEAERPEIEARMAPLTKFLYERLRESLQEKQREIGEEKAGAPN